MTSEAINYVANIHKATLMFNGRAIWRDLELKLKPGEFLAVLGPNGSGKSSLLKVLLGLYNLKGGTAEVHGKIGYVPQQRNFEAGLPVSGRDVVRLGIDGTAWGLMSHSAEVVSRVEAAIEAVGAEAYADYPIGQLSGGQQQRIRIAQALVSRPKLLLCDEPLLSLDPGSQRLVSELIDAQRANGCAVVFVTHEINPVLPYADRLLYLVGGRWKLGKPQEVLTSAALSELYGTPVEVLKVRGRILVVAGDEAVPTEPMSVLHHDHAGELDDV